MRNYLICSIIFFLLLSCSNKQISSSVPSIAYVDLRALYNYTLTHDPEFILFKKDSSFLNVADNELKPHQIEVKRSILLKIESAVRYIATENGLTIVLNKGDTLVYANSSLDITQSVINELKIRNSRRSPLAP